MACSRADASLFAARGGRGLLDGDGDRGEGDGDEAAPLLSDATDARCDAPGASALEAAAAAAAVAALARCFRSTATPSACSSLTAACEGEAGGESPSSSGASDPSARRR